MLLRTYPSIEKKIEQIIILFVFICLSQINAFSQTEKLKVLENTVPNYPPTALAVKAQGITTCRIIVNQDGTVEQTEMLSGHPLLRSATEASVKKWKFNAVSNEKERETTITIEYLISKEKSLNQEQTVEFKNPFYAVIQAKQLVEVKNCCPKKSFLDKVGSFFKNLFT